MLKNLRAAGAIRLYPVNPKHERLSGLTCWATVGALPEIVDLAVICTPAATVPGLVRECGEAGIRGLVILTAGFGETGPAGRVLEATIKREAAQFPDLRILGPNCLGLMSPHRGLNASFVDQLPPPGNVAFLSQSGALCSAILDWAASENVGFSYFISLGNMLDVVVYNSWASFTRPKRSGPSVVTVKVFMRRL